LAIDAAAAGVGFAIVLSPGYYAGALKSEGGKGLRKFFVDVANSSPIPIVIYNFPAVSGGIDLDSDFAIDVAKASPNVVGVKLT
jgi:4-hydroxy-2-oxoglutarate aldolase